MCMYEAFSSLIPVPQLNTSVPLYFSAPILYKNLFIQNVVEFVEFDDDGLTNANFYCNFKNYLV